MSITRDVDVWRVEVGDDYSIEVTVFDVLTGTRATVSLSLDEAVDAKRDLANVVLEARAKIRADRVPGVSHGFDVDLIQGMSREVIRAEVACVDCSEGKHRACIGSAYRESLDESALGDVEEVECSCARVNHPGSIS